MRKIVLAFILTLVATPAFAQVTDHWESAKDCLAATGPYYVPRVKSAKPVKRGEQVIGYEWGGCFDMDLTSSEGGRGWVRLPPGSRVVVDVASGKPLRLEECNNRIYGFEPFPPPEKTVLAPAATALDLSGVVAAVDRGSTKLADAITKAAASAQPQASPQPFVVKVEKDEEKSGPHFWNWKRKSGKSLIIGVPAAVLATGYLCHKYGCFTTEQTSTTTVIVNR